MHRRHITGRIPGHLIPPPAPHPSRPALSHRRRPGGWLRAPRASASYPSWPRILWLHASGSRSFAAVAWCAAQDVTVSLLDSYGNLLSTLTPEAPADVALRRAQYRAQDTGQDVVLARELLRRKLERQRETIQAHPELPHRERAHEALHMALSWLSLPEATPYLSTLDGIRTFEGRTARAYLAAWVGLPVTFARADRRRIPPHWQSVREHTSPLAGNRNARHAVDPANALLNYAYGCLESEARQALTGTGFDLSCGFLHSDKAGPRLAGLRPDGMRAGGSG